jgi:Transposase domain (DUF772)
MERVLPWAVRVQIVEPHYPKAKTGRPPFGIETMLRIHNLQQWFGLSDPAMEEALRDVPLYREFTRLDGVMARLPDETTILLRTGYAGLSALRNACEPRRHVGLRQDAHQPAGAQYLLQLGRARSSMVCLSPASHSRPSGHASRSTERNA